MIISMIISIIISTMVIIIIILNTISMKAWALSKTARSICAQHSGGGGCGENGNWGTLPPYHRVVYIIIIIIIVIIIMPLQYRCIAVKL